jgi:hypothetical protein
VRADSGFYGDHFLSFLEARAWPFIVVARLTSYLKSRLYQVSQWQAIDKIYCVTEFRFKLWNWKTERRFVVVREEVQTSKAAVGRKLLDLPGYVFRVLDTNRHDSPLEIWRDYNGRRLSSAALTNSKTNWRLITSACDLSLRPSRLSWRWSLGSIS